MTDRLTKTALSGALVLLTLAAAPAALAAPVTVNLRVEGVAGTIFDGPVVTDSHQTTTPTDGVARPCERSLAQLHLCARDQIANLVDQRPLGR